MCVFYYCYDGFYMCFVHIGLPTKGFNLNFGVFANLCMENVGLVARVCGFLLYRIVYPVLMWALSHPYSSIEVLDDRSAIPHPS